MDPNHWNSYNFQYGAAQGGLTPTHPSLGLSLSHSLQGTHGSITGRSVPAIPTYSGLSVPLLETMAPLSSAIQPQQAHKTVSIGEASQLVFDSQVRGSNEQLSPSLNRYDAGNKVIRTESLSRHQLLEAARVWGGPNFPSSSSLYNQYSAILPEVVMPSNAASISTSPSAGSYASSKSSQSLLQEPPPAHSSSVARATACQRPQHMGDLIYSRTSESLNPSSLISSHYSSGLMKEVHTSNQPQTPHGYLLSQRESDNLSSSSAQHQLYGSYANLAGVDSQEFTAAHLSNDITYEAVSPAAPIQQENTTPAHVENPSYPAVQFSEFTSLAPEHAQALEKFQENDYRLKADPMRSQHVSQENLSYHHSVLRQDIKMSKDVPSPIQSVHMTQQNSVFSHIQPTANIIHSSSPHHPPHSGSQTLSSIQQQLQSQPTVQAPADSTTKPKRVRNRKKKGEVATTTSAAAVSNTKKSISQTSVNPIQQHRLSSLHMPPSSQISTLSMPHSPLISHDSQQQPGYPPSVNNQFTNREAQRAQTPSVPQNYSLNEHQGFTHSASPKIQTNPPALMSPSYAMASRGPSEKSTYKQQQRKQKESSSPSVNQNNSQPLYVSNIPNNQMNVQSYSDPIALISLPGQTDSPVQSGNHRVGPPISRINSFSSLPAQHQPQQSLGSSMPNLSRQSPQDSISSGNKLHSSSQYMGNTNMMNMQQSVADSRPSGTTQAQSPLESQQPPVVMNQTPTGFESRGTPVIMDSGQDPSNQFQVDLSGQPFLEQLVNAQNPNFGQGGAESEEVMLTTLVPPAPSAPIQEEQTAEDAGFRPTYHGEAVHEIHPVGPICGELNAGDMSFNNYDAQNSMNSSSMISHNHSQSSYSEYSQVEVEPMTLTFMPSVEEDDEFSHFGIVETAPVKKETDSPKPNPGKKDSFQSSFLSYLQGNKQETLSSVSSAAITKKPQLPKYIPEPKRPKPNITVLTKDPILLSDTDDVSVSSAQGKEKDKEKDFLSTLSDNDNSSQKSESDKEGYTVQRTSELAMKITLPKGKKKGKVSTLGESALLSHNKKQLKEDKFKIKKRKGKHGEWEEDDYAPGARNSAPSAATSRKPSPPPARTSIGRKAKDRCLEKNKKKRKYAESGSSTEDEMFPVKGNLASDKDYDSDKDPVWMPFDQDLKAGYDFEEKKKKTKRVRLRAPIRAPPAPKTSVQELSVSAKAPSVVSKKPEQSTTASPANAQEEKPESIFKVGQYFIEKKDLQNCDNYPIWRLEEGSMIHKYELVIVEGVVRHKAVGTYSTWMKSMYDLFQPIKVNELMLKGKSDSLLVQVLEESQPKMPTDGKLLQQYEDDPLVEHFNVYLQVFISQALEPTFLKAIIDMAESFYLNPLNEIDRLIDEKVKKLAATAKWRSNFQEALHRCPLMKEIDRPNLKQACQACENSSTPSIKSVLLSGQPYDRTFLTNIQNSGSDVALEFMIGKVAALFVRPYHSLYHFKYWLRTRCEAKVKIMKESNKSESLSGESILDKCLENRNWVLQLFDNFKKLLAFDGDSSR